MACQTRTDAEPGTERLKEEVVHKWYRTGEKCSIDLHAVSGGCVSVMGEWVSCVGRDMKVRNIRSSLVGEKERVRLLKLGGHSSCRLSRQRQKHYMTIKIKSTRERNNFVEMESSSLFWIDSYFFASPRLAREVRWSRARGRDKGANCVQVPYPLEGKKKEEKKG